jgi:hypothetical protein
MTVEPLAEALDAYDGPWKAGIDAFLPDMMELLFPAAHAAIDWRQPMASLNSELRSLMPGEEAATGRIADSLYQVVRHGGAEQWIVIHIEVQNTPDAKLAERMFVYLCRCYEKYGAKVFGYAVLGDHQASYRPAPFGWEMGGGRLLYQFETAKLLEFRDRIQELEESRNPFALIVLAHLYTKETKNDQDRRRAFKLRLIRLLLRREYRREQIEKLFLVIDWVMRLDEEQAIIFKQEVRSLREDGNMNGYVSTWEIVGRQEGALQVLSSQLARRFGELPAWVGEKMKFAPIATIERWSLQLLDAKRLEDVFA